eukprot:CAMPEP_0115299414 /NCGR_PEP_ID=MMETSP0270-20121206/68779_1 /TAXON_ID=71861 /ORGANISM="Scrippsiella trochoidea, Strain CCMP3099" /LENGTH=36 /DNA_ID= /DNA_START= /DNA_END= /DNA_ORIENTATION=
MAVSGMTRRAARERHSISQPLDARTDGSAECELEPT